MGIQTPICTWKGTYIDPYMLFYVLPHLCSTKICFHVGSFQKCCAYTCALYQLYTCSFHNQLKTVHLNGKVNRRVDFLVHHLFQYEKDAFFRYKKDRQLPPAMHKRMKLELTYHHRALQIPSASVQVSKLLQSIMLVHLLS